jgi:hypothetical protein
MYENMSLYVEWLRKKYKHGVQHIPRKSTKQATSTTCSCLVYKRIENNNDSIFTATRPAIHGRKMHSLESQEGKFSSHFVYSVCDKHKQTPTYYTS